MIGTLPWTAPEYLSIDRISERNEKGDVFSFGVIVWELVTQKGPWKEEKYSRNDLHQAVMRGNRLKIPANCPEELHDIMTKCWNNSKIKLSFFLF